MSKQIKITIPLDGEVTIEAIGFQGCGCTDATKVFEEALGAVTKRTKKTEYHQTATLAQKQTLRGVQ